MNRIENAYHVLVKWNIPLTSHDAAPVDFGYAIGDPEDIKEFYRDERGDYEIELKPIRLREITSRSLKEKARLLDKVSDLERQIRAIKGVFTMVDIEQKDEK